MRYDEFEKRIEQMAAAASPNARRRFALDTIRLLHQSAVAAAQEELTAEEQGLLSALVSGVEVGSPDDLAGTLADLDKSMCRDSVRAIEFHPNITQLLCGLDNWIKYRRTGDPHLIAGLAINRVNTVDYAISGNVAEYSVNNMLGAPAMVAEFQRQQRLLVPEVPVV